MALNRIKKQLQDMGREASYIPCFICMNIVLTMLCQDPSPGVCAGPVGDDLVLPYGDMAVVRCGYTAI